ncbi:MAG: efflux transporter outer membrane subunit [Planctomycetota bacterium]
MRHLFHETRSVDTELDSGSCRRLSKTCSRGRSAPPWTPAGATPRILILLVCLLPSCTMIPDYERPEAPVPETWPGALAPAGAVSGDAATSLAQTSWKDFFLSEGLQDCITRALEHNRDLKVAALNMESARALYSIRSDDLLPSIDAQASGSRQGIPRNLSANGRSSTEAQYRANIAATEFELDFFGKIRSLNEAALQEFLASEEAHRSARITLVSEVAQAYLQWAGDLEVVGLLERSLESQAKTADLVRASYERGAFPKREHLRAQAALESARERLAMARRRVSQDVNALSLLTGMGSGSACGIWDGRAVSLDEVKLLSKLPVGLPSEVLLARPDILAAEHRLMAMNARIGVMRAAFFPSISLTGSFGYASDSLSSLFTGGSYGAWTFVPSISTPLFQGGRNQANLEHAKVQHDLAVAQYEKAVQSAFREVADALAAQEPLDTQFKARHSRYELAMEAYAISKARHERGLDGLLDLLEAQGALDAARQSLVEAKREQLANLVGVYKVLGGGRAIEKH